VLDSIVATACSKIVLVSDIKDEVIYREIISQDLRTEIVSLTTMYRRCWDKIGDEISVDQMRTFCPPSTWVRGEIWDLPSKRNAALLYAALRGYRHLILLDDDIYGIGAGLLDGALTASRGLALFGVQIEHFPDLSIFDHVQRILYGDCQRFIAGNCLVIDLDQVSGYFPPVYNEDWLFVFAHPRQLVGYASNRVVRQRPYDPFDPDVAGWQEFGDTLAEGLFNLWARDKISDCVNSQFWETILESRKSFFERMYRDLSLTGGSAIRNVLKCVEAAQGEAFRLDGRVLAQFATTYRVTCDRYAELLLLLRKQFANCD
jgi:hypothetical protein